MADRMGRDARRSARYAHAPIVLWYGCVRRNAEAQGAYNASHTLLCIRIAVGHDVRGWLH